MSSKELEKTLFYGGTILTMNDRQPNVEAVGIESEKIIAVGNLEEVKQHENVLTPGRYVGIEDVEDDGISFEEKMGKMTSELGELFEKSRRIEEEVRKNLGGIGYEF